MLKVPLLIDRPKPGAWRNPNMTLLPVKSAPPFFWSRAGTRTHRVRSVTIIGWTAGQHPSHTAVHLWCGMSGFLYRAGKAGGGKLGDAPPEELPYCATCEGRAIGAGQLPIAQINGKSVVFSPRNAPSRPPSPTDLPGGAHEE